MTLNSGSCLFHPCFFVEGANPLRMHVLKVAELQKI